MCKDQCCCHVSILWMGGCATQWSASHLTVARSWVLFPNQLFWGARNLAPIHWKCVVYAVVDLPHFTVLYHTLCQNSMQSKTRGQSLYVWKRISEWGVRFDKYNWWQLFLNRIELNESVNSMLKNQTRHRKGTEWQNGKCKLNGAVVPNDHCDWLSSFAMWHSGSNSAR